MSFSTRNMDIETEFEAMKAQTEIENPFSFMSDRKWEQYKQREMNFTEFPVYVSIKPAELNNLERMIRMIGYEIIGRYTRNSTHIPFTYYEKGTTHNWSQETVYFCMCKQSMSTMSIVIYEKSVHFFTDEPVIRFEPIFHIDFIDIFKKGGAHNITYPTFEYVSGGQSSYSCDESSTSYFSLANQKNHKLTEELTFDVLKACTSKNKFKRGHVIPKIKGQYIKLPHSLVVHESFRPFVDLDVYQKIAAHPMVESRVGPILYTRLSSYYDRIINQVYGNTCRMRYEFEELIPGSDPILTMQWRTYKKFCTVICDFIYNGGPQLTRRECDEIFKGIHV